MNDSRRHFDVLSGSGRVKLLLNCCTVAHIFPPYVATLPRPVCDIKGGVRNVSYTHTRSTIDSKSLSVSVYLHSCTVQLRERRTVPKYTNAYKTVYFLKKISTDGCLSSRLVNVLDSGAEQGLGSNRSSDAVG